MLPERPPSTSVPCPVCGETVDALRAPRVLWLEDGVRFLCGDACRARFLDGDRRFDAPEPRAARGASSGRPSIPDMVREATLVREDQETARATGTANHPYDPLLATGLAMLAGSLVAATPAREIGWLAALLLVLCAAVNARISMTVLRVERALLWVAPAGLALAAIAGVLEESLEMQRWALAATAVAGLAVSGRRWIQSWASAPVRSAAKELSRMLPDKARIPAAEASAYEEVQSSRLRQGDLAVVLGGELAPSDGVVEEGSAAGLRFPGATQPTSYRDGDFILAGTRILEGAITIRVRRTGSARAVARAARLGAHPHHDRSWASGARFLLAQWSWVLLAPAALAVLVWLGPAEAGTLLLGLPVLAVVASFDVPVEAAGIAAARRGMFFGSPGALRDAGRAGTTAILLRGALTAGEPRVEQVTPVGSVNIDRVLALAAAAELAAADHPIARAIRGYAEEAGLRRALVRKQRVLPGLGVTGVTSRGVPVVVGRRQLLLDEGVSVAAADQEAAHVESEGLTPIFVAVDGNLAALLTVLDPTHVGASDAVHRISDLPSEVVILSGDDRRTVERIASNLGASRVKAPLLPHERVNEVRALRETGGVVAAIGRGGDDDAVLAAADVPISLRLVGTALEDRGIVITSLDVRDAAGALWIARAARRSTWRSLGGCLAIAAIVVAGATVGWMGPAPGALLAVGTEAWALRAGSRLLRRVDLRVPMRQ